MNKLPFPGVNVECTADDKQYTQSIPFDVRLYVRAIRQINQVDVVMDPRIVFKPAGQRIIGSLLDREICGVVSPNNLFDMCNRIVNRLHDLHSKDGVVAFKNLHLETEALWEHDCDKCIYLGTSEENDMYFCDNTISHTLISRFGSYGHQYISGASFVEAIPEIWKAAVLAEARGFGSFLSDHHMIVIEDYIPGR
jgi:hypothetical protein